MTMQVITQDLTAYEGQFFEDCWTWEDADGNVIDTSAAEINFHVRDAIGGTLLLDGTTGSGNTEGGTDGRVVIRVNVADYGGSFVTGNVTQHWPYSVTVVLPGEEPRPFRAGYFTLVPVA